MPYHVNIQQPIIFQYIRTYFLYCINVPNSLYNSLESAWGQFLLPKHQKYCVKVAYCFIFDADLHDAYDLLFFQHPKTSISFINLRLILILFTEFSKWRMLLVLRGSEMS